MKEKTHEIKNIVEHLADAQNSTHGVGGILTRLWYRILYDLKMEPMLFEYFLGLYVNTENQKPRTDLGSAASSNVAKHFTKGNLRRELLSNPGMTFKSFIRGLRILRVYKVRLIVEIHRAQEIPTIHETTINLTDCPDTPDDVEVVDPSKLTAVEVVRSLRENEPSLEPINEAAWEQPRLDPSRVIRR